MLKGVCDMETNELETTLQEVLKKRIEKLPEDKLWQLYAITNRYEADRRKSLQEAELVLKGA